LPESEIQVVDCGSTKVDSILQIVTEFGSTPTRVRMNEIERSQPADYDGIIISGSPILLTEADYADTLKSLNFVRACYNPVLGICFGQQIIGLSYGAKVFRGPECRVDEIVEVLEKGTLFEGLDNRLYLNEDHCEGITLSNEFILLARSQNYMVEAMKHRNKAVYGVQFHPEASGEIGKAIIHNFLKSCRNASHRSD
jgi:GMP synthase (glutamine-hydrolysing)